MNNCIKFTIILILISLLPVSAAELPSRVLMDRPAGAPRLEMPRFDRIDAALLEEGVARVIVRLTPPDDLAGGFVVESHIRDRGAVSRQRDAITKKQRQVLGKMKRQHATRAKQFGFIPFMAVEVDQDDLLALTSSPDVDFIQEDAVMYPDLRESIPLIGGVGGAFDGATGAGQTVAVIDTGVDRTHPFLTGKVVDEACYSTIFAPNAISSLCPNGQTSMIGPGSGANCNGSLYGCFHGTHVAGIVAGTNASFSGVAKGAGVIAIQVFSRSDSSAYCGGAAPCIMAFSSDLLSALDRVYALRGNYQIAAINMSLGGGLFTTNCDSEDPATKAAIDTLRAAGIATVVSSGNDYSSTGISFPACISSAVSIGATTKADRVDGYSNSAAILNLLAPGTSIYSSLPGTGYGYLSGTSMAAPHVAGAWAVLKSVKPLASVAEVLTVLTTTGVPVTDARNGLTKPRIKLDDAVKSLKLVNITVRTSPDGLGYSVDGQNYVGSRTFSWTPGSSHTIATPSPQSEASGARYFFATWSDNGAQSHNYIVPATPGTVTANFSTQYKLRTSANFGATAPAGESYYAPDTPVTVTVAPLFGYHVTGWTVNSVFTPSTAVSFPVTVSQPTTTVSATLEGGTPILSAALVAKPVSGGNGTVYWTYRLTNKGTGPAATARINRLTVTQTLPTAPKCTVTVGALPTSQNIPANNGTADFPIPVTFSGCSSSYRFTGVVSYSDGGNAAGSLTLKNLGP